MLSEVALNAKAGVATAITTTASGVSTWFGWLPSDIGKIATVFGALLSLVLIVVHIRKGIHEWKEDKKKSIEAEAERQRERIKDELEIEALKHKIASIKPIKGEGNGEANRQHNKRNPNPNKDKN